MFVLTRGHKFRVPLVAIKHNYDEKLLKGFFNIAAVGPMFAGLEVDPNTWGLFLLNYS